ncbi:MAG: GxxExxY protein [Pirellulales bacterium]
MREPSQRVDDLARQVIGAAIEVHRILGPGFLESVYEEALAIEFTLRNIPFERQKPILLIYKDNPVGDSRLDFLVGEELVVELKAVEIVHPIHPAKVINYLKMTGLDLGLIINFHVEQLRDGIKRIVVT